MNKRTITAGERSNYRMRPSSNAEEGLDAKDKKIGRIGLRVVFQAYPTVCFYLEHRKKTMMKHLLMILCAALFGGANNVALAADPLFTPQQLTELKATGRDIIVPLHLPAGYKVKKVITDIEHPKTPSYAILFVGPESACFVIEMGTEVGDLIVENDKGEMLKPTSKIHSPVLGDALFWDTPEYLGTDWFPPHKDTAYRIKGDIAGSVFSKDKRAPAICKKRMDGTELIKAAKSLGVLER